MKDKQELLYEMIDFYFCVCYLYYYHTLNYIKYTGHAMFVVRHVWTFLKIVQYNVGSSRGSSVDIRDVLFDIVGAPYLLRKKIL